MSATLLASDPRAQAAAFAPKNKKPQRWPIQPDQTAMPWFWDVAGFVAPLWEGGGQAIDIARKPLITGLKGTFSGNAGWAGTAVGLGAEFTGGGSDRLDFGSVNMVFPKDGNNRFAIEVLVRVGSTAADQGVFANGPFAASSNWFMWWDQSAAVSGRSNTITFAVQHFGNGQLSRVESSSNLVDDGKFHHIVAQFRQTPETVELYHEGVLDQSDTQLNGVNPSDADAGALQIGAVDSTRELTGAVALAVYYPRLLTASEIRQRALDPFAPFRPRLEATVPVGVAAGGATVLGAATLDGLGDLTGDADLQIFAASTLAGVGDLTGAADLLIAAAATLAGTGDLAGAAFVRQQAAAALAGAGDLAGAAFVQQQAEAALAGSGDITGAAKLTIPAAATLAGSGNLTATAEPEQTANDDYSLRWRRRRGR